MGGICQTGRNFIIPMGGEAVSSLTTEVNRRLFAEGLDPTKAVGHVLYGLPDHEAHMLQERTGTTWIEPTKDFGDSDMLCFISGVDIPEKLENHIVWFYSKVDPNIVLCNKYDSDRGEFVGVRFKFVRKGKIFTVHKRLLMDEYVVFEIDQSSDFSQITWEQFWEIQHRLYQEARKELIELFPEANHIVYE